MKKRYPLILAILVMNCFSAFSQAPTNDVCANAIPITVNGGYITVDNSTAVTNGPNPSCGGSTTIKDVWYSFVYTGGTVVIETQLGTNTDTRLAIYTTCGGTQLACNDDFGGTYRSSITLTCSALVAGNTYLIQAGGYNAVAGAFTLSVSASGILGCTNPMATNYSSCATQNDGTCIFPTLTAQFNYAPTGTNCLNVQYTSTSSGNITGYAWTFPGGNPSSSNLQNPVITYPSAGTYSSTLVITDANGTSTVTNNNVVVTAGDIVTVDITPDANPSQTSWKMFDNNNVVVAQGTSNDATFCINSFCHRFEIYDSGSNGLASPGGYKIYLNGVEVASGATFAARDIRDVNCPQGTSCNHPLNATLGVNDVPFDNSWYVFTPAENGQYRISTCGYAACDTRIWIYEYCVMANFDNTVVATYTYNDDFCGVQAQSDVFMTGGHTYYVRVGSAGACAGNSYQALFEYVGPIIGCTDNLACNYSPLASVSGPCYYNGDPNCSGLGPDLSVDLSQFYSSLTSTTLTSTDACLVNEGCLQSTVGTRQILRFTTRIANVGTQDYFIGVPNASNPQFVFDGCHNHYHYAGYAEYLLYNAAGNPMPNIGFKNGFCVLDLSCPTGITAHYSCGNMGITAGCADIYSSSLSCQWIDVTNVPAGDYFLVIRTNWDQSPDANGHYELRYDNNWAQVCIHFERDANNNIINFTKSIATCPVIEDCLGVPFGNHYPDCAGNCPGTVIQGDINNDGYFTAYDEHLYAEASINGGVAVTPCNDLNSDGEITVADASYVADCIHHQQDLGVNPLQYTSCGWDPETWDNENVTLGITNLNTAQSYFDIYIVNPQNEIYALQLDLSGAVISSMENLLPTATWNAHLHQEVGGNSIAVTSELHTWIPVSFTPRSILRVHYSSLSGASVCISNIVDVLNDFNHNVLATIGDCASPLAAVTADFSASQTSICSGQSISFNDLSTGNPTGWSWTFQGGTPATSNGANPTVQYAAGGTYNVTLTATGPGGSDTEVKTGYISVGTSVQWYYDGDNDGYGTNSNVISSCVAPAGFVSIGGDCQDLISAIHPGAVEICNSIDDDCDGSYDEGFDQDNDGYTVCDGDCNDNSVLAFPGAFEICNGLDENCNGTIDEGYDTDGDGFTICNGDCNDSNSSVHPGASESCNGVDDNCNGSLDEGFDVDGDGYTTCNGDCNDTNINIKPGVTELCNGIDDDCDSALDEGFDIDGDGFTTCNGDCNDSNINVNPEASELCNTVDDDCNGIVDEGFDTDGDGFTSCSGDCNDTNSAIHPGATEICNGVDENCNGTTDEGFDVDGDGFTTCNGDCNDNNSSVKPSAIESCNGLDDNCNGFTDEGLLIAFYQDSDNDGYGIAGNTILACSAPAGYASVAGDCNDAVFAIHPGATEACNSLDDNCNSSTDEGFDNDGDGYTSCNGDCNDNSSAVHPGSVEICNGVDDNCDALIDEGFDLDGDGFTPCSGDCNEDSEFIYPGALETCNGADDDCDGLIDENLDLDNDGYTNCNGDCNDNNPSIHPNAIETCNGVDDNCNSTIDEGFDLDNDGYTVCNGDCNDNNPIVFPGSAELCNGVDEDCDGVIDEGFDLDGDGYTSCNGDCNDNNAAIRPGATEICNILDDNCNGLIDENSGLIYYRDADNDGYGNPSLSVQACTVPTGYVNNNLDCADNNSARHPGAVESCNGVDDNCNGVIDETCSIVANDLYQNATTLSVFTLNNCTTVNGTLTGATVSAQAHSTVAAGGQDVWYKFVATAIGIRIRVTTTAFDALVELQDASGNMLNVENIQNIKGNEYLNYAGLTIGSTYYIAVRNNNSALGTGTFKICLNSRPNSSCGSSAGTYSLCSSFTAVNTSATSYKYNFTSVTTGLTYTRTLSSTSCVLYNVAGLPDNDSYNVRIDAIYNLTLGNGTTESITVVGPTTCSAVITLLPALYLRNTMVCPSVRSFGTQLRMNATTCGVTNYQWEFQLANLSQPAFYINAGTSSTVVLSLAAGFTTGQTYNVRIRETLAGGYTTAWGPVRCLITSTSAMIMQESDPESQDKLAQDEIQINLYPNPNRGDGMNLFIDHVKEGQVVVRVLDGLGRQMWSSRFITTDYLNTELTFENELPSGVYVMEFIFDGKLITKKFVVQK